MAIVARKVVHIVQCVQAEVIFRETRECYMHLPIFNGNKTFLLTPGTHIISSTGTQTSCNTLVLSMYFWDDKWFKMSPITVEGLTSNIMMPQTTPIWEWTNPSSLATSDIHSQTDLDKIRDQIMFNVENPMVSNSLGKILNSIYKF